jgi:hypothetical protein
MMTPPNPARTTSRMQRLLKLMRQNSGGALLEVALMLSMLGVPMLLGIADAADLVYSSIEIASASHAGAMFGMTSATYASDTAGIVTAAQTEAADFGANLTVSPTVYFACSAALGGTQYSTQAAASSACTGTGNHALEFLQVYVSAVVTPPVRCPGMAASYTLKNTSIEEVEE